MPIGPGMYDTLCTVVREQAEARAAIVIVLNGNKGSGFSIQAHESVTPKKLADILQATVDAIRAAG